MTSRLATILGSAAVAAALLLQAGDGMAQQRSQIGTLQCSLRPSVGLIVIQQQRMDCRFTRGHSSRVERYTGNITRLGVNVGFTTRGKMIWGVFARSNVPTGALAGRFGGVSAGASLGAGIGANALIGGSNDSVVLQPISIQGQVGVNFAAGVAGLRLRYVK